MNICVVTVTYGNRFILLEKVLNTLFQKEIKKIIVVDNGSTSGSRQALDNFAGSSALPIEVVSMKKNTGSAKGFKTGLEKALTTNCDFIWILDDDNLPQPTTLSTLIDSWGILTAKQDYSKVALLSNRIDRQNFLKAIYSQNPDDVLQRKNNFMGFHWADMWEKFYERLMKKGLKDIKFSQDLPLYAKVSAAPYGGLFFHKTLLNNISLPDEMYVLYLDDFAFTIPITRNNGTIWLVRESILEDVERSVYLPKSKKWLHHLLFEGKKQHSYYALRNMLYFCHQYLKTNNWVYSINKISFCIIIFFMAMLRGEPGRLFLLRQAIQDATNKKMGLNASYIL